MASSAVADSFVGRDEARKEAQLREARASGQAAPEIDDSTGKMINPHNPEFITKAPWYLNQGKPSLKHHQAWNNKQFSSALQPTKAKGVKEDVKTKFIKGACENCGATTHTKKDCVERPRQHKALHSKKNLMPDEHIVANEMGYEGKRDRWNGWEADDDKERIEEWEKVEQERRRVKAAEMQERAKLKERLKAQKKDLKKKRKVRRRQIRRLAEGRNADGTDTDGTEGTDTDGDSDTDTDTDSDSDASDDEDLGEKMKDFDKTTAAVATKDEKLRTTTRNLRIREDTAKYLLNLDVNSAFYDPKSRSMRANPLAHLKEEEQGAYKGDNFVRNAGDSKSLLDLTLFAWDAYKHGEKIHDIGQPTQALKMYEVFKNRSADLKEEQQKELIEKYGGDEHLNAPQELLFSQNDNYVEYARDGRILKGRERAYVKSKYEEDVLVGNHTSTWGSFYDAATGKFGYKCCHQTSRRAYCLPLKREDGAADVAIADDGQEQIEVGGGGAGTEKVASSSESDESEESGEAQGEAGAVEQKKRADAEKKAERRQARALEGLKLRAGEAATSKAAAPADSAAPSTVGEAASSSSAPKLGDKRNSAFGHNLEDEVDNLDEQKVAEAVREAKRRRKEERREEKAQSALTVADERNRGYNSKSGDTQTTGVTAEEFEAYRLTKPRSDDPMAKFT